MMIKAEGISRTFFRNGSNSNYFYAVEKTDFTMEEGHLTALIGRSGSGKTTFSNMLCGLLTPDEGKVFIDGKDLYSLPDEERAYFRNRVFGIIPQGQTGLQSLTVIENVLLPAAMYGDGSEKKDKAEELLKRLKIESLKEVYANELSGGELRRMAIARALINDPQIIIADEPTGDLDDESTGDVLKLLKETADNGAAVLLVTHDREVLKYADAVYRMNKGVLTLHREES